MAASWARPGMKRRGIEWKKYFLLGNPVKTSAKVMLELKEIFYLVLSHPLWQSGSYENYYQSSHENRI